MDGEELIPSKDRKMNFGRCLDPGPALPAAGFRTPGTHFFAYPLNHQKHQKTFTRPPKNAFPKGPKMTPKWTPQWPKRALCAPRAPLGTPPWLSGLPGGPPKAPRTVFWAPRWPSRDSQNGFPGPRRSPDGPPGALDAWSAQQRMA